MALFSEPRRLGSTSWFGTKCPVAVGDDTRRAGARHHVEIWLRVLLDQRTADLQLFLPQVCEMCFVIYQEEAVELRREEVVFTVRVLSRLTAMMTCTASLGWRSTVTCCNIYRGYSNDVPVGNK